MFLKVVEDVVAPRRGKLFAVAYKREPRDVQSWRKNDGSGDYRTCQGTSSDLVDACYEVVSLRVEQQLLVLSWGQPCQLEDLPKLS